MLNGSVAADDRNDVFWAAVAGDVEIARRYIAHGGQVDVRDKRGRTPLMYAAERGNSALVTLFLEAGADPGATTADGATAMELAAKDEIRSVLMRALAEPETAKPQ